MSQFAPRKSGASLLALALLALLTVSVTARPIGESGSETEPEAPSMVQRRDPVWHTQHMNMTLTPS